MLVACAGTSRAGVVLSFDPATQTVMMPATASVNLVVSGLGGGVSPGLGGFQFNILYDPIIVLALDVTFGLDLGDPGLFEALTTSDVTSPGSASLAEISLLAPTDLLAMQSSSSFVMATIDFQTVGAGTTLLNYDSVVLSDESGNKLAFSAAAGSITVLAPEPTLGSIVGGLLLMAMAAARRVQ